MRLLGLAEIALEETVDIEAVLGRERLVEPVALAERLDGGGVGCRLLAQVRRHRVAGDELREQEGDERDPEPEQDEGDEAPRQEAEERLRRSQRRSPRRRDAYDCGLLRRQPTAIVAPRGIFPRPALTRSRDSGRPTASFPPVWPLSLHGVCGMLNLEHTQAAVRAELKRGRGHAAGDAEAAATSGAQPAPVLRIEIYADPAPPRDGAAETPEIALLVPGLAADAREANGAGRAHRNGTRGVDSVPAPLGVTPLSHARNGRRSTDMHEPAPQLERLPEVAEREAELDRAQELADGERARLERRKGQLAEMEKELQERRRELDERDAALEVREAEREVAFELREDRVEQQERELAALDERLRRKESELAAYVAQVQQHLASGRAGAGSA